MGATQSHLTTGVAYVNFYSIDPKTGLPPEDQTGRGMGYFTFIIKNKEGLPTGTNLRNIANIVFDYQTAIATNQKDPHDPDAGTDPEKECPNTIANHPVNLTVSAVTVSAPAQATSAHDWGENISLSAAANAGYQFAGWTGDVETITGPATANAGIFMAGDYVVTATFKRDIPLVPGDINGDGNVDLKDAVAALQVLSKVDIPDIQKDADANNDKTIGIEDVIYILQADSIGLN